MIRRLRDAALLTAAAGLGAVLALGVAPAAAESTTTDNPWAHTMTADGPGLVVTGDDGAQNDPALLVEDYLDQPIFTVLEAGGAAVLGDDFRIMHGSDPYNGQITLSQNNPVASVCVRNGQLWIGGADGRIWRCADLDGGTWNGAWWLAL